jgi:hypothetical protein
MKQSNKKKWKIVGDIVLDILLWIIFFPIAIWFTIKLIKQYRSNEYIDNKIALLNESVH